MNRKDFLKSLAMIPLAGAVSKLKSSPKSLHHRLMNLNELKNLTNQASSSDKMPVLFIGHGNPMNAITDNSYRKTWVTLGKELPAPKAILCISAHWLTKGTSVTMTDAPQTIHDFGGFPDELFKIKYPAPGAVDYAKMAISEVKTTKVHEDFEWGLDHGAWSVLMNMYPAANVPIFQMSIDYTKPPEYHYKVGQELIALRKKGVLIVASGNVVHNLGMISWKNEPRKFDWAIEFDQMVKNSIEDHNDTRLVEYQKLGKLAEMAHPTNDHYLPLVYAIALRDKADEFSFFNDSFDLGSVSMRSVVFS